MRSAQRSKNSQHTRTPHHTVGFRDSLLQCQLEIFPKREISDHDAAERSQLATLSLPKADAILNQTLQQSTIRSDSITQYLETNRQFSRGQTNLRNTEQIVLAKKESSRGRKKTQTVPIYVNKDYPYFNLTLTFYNMRAPKKLTFPLFLTSLIVRLYTICYLCFVFVLGLKDHEFDRWQWIIALVISRMLFIILVFRVSLSVADSIVETILKNVWNRRENNLEQLFQRITWKTISQTTQRALVPPELSFVYLFKENKKRRYEVYAVINFIYMSIETMVFYPFVIGYSFIVLAKDEDLVGFYLYTKLTVVVTSGWIIVFIILSFILFVRGWRISREKVK